MFLGVRATVACQTQQSKCARTIASGLCGFQRKGITRKGPGSDTTASCAFVRGKRQSHQVWFRNTMFRRRRDGKLCECGSGEPGSVYGYGELCGSGAAERGGVRGKQRHLDGDVEVVGHIECATGDISYSQFGHRG